MAGAVVDGSGPAIVVDTVRAVAGAACCAAAVGGGATLADWTGGVAVVSIAASSVCGTASGALDWVGSGVVGWGCGGGATGCVAGAVWLGSISNTERAALWWVAPDIQ